MSAAASWSYTADATHWPLLSRAGWSGAVAFGAPVAFKCDYASAARSRSDSRGREHVAGLTLYTERSSIKRGDRVMLGVSTAADPVAAGAVEVVDVFRDADTLDRKADDFRVVC